MSTELTTVRLYGNLAEICELREVKLQINSVAEIIKALICNFPEVKKELEKEESRYSILIGSTDIEEQELFIPFSKTQVVRIIPVIAGSGGVFKIVLGVALIWATGGFGAGTGLGFLTGAGIGGTIGGIVGSIGMSLLLGGVASLFMGSQKTPAPAEAAENTPSFYFKGAVNTIAQGHPVPVGYGELLVGSAVIGAGLTAVDI